MRKKRAKELGRRSELLHTDIASEVQSEIYTAFQLAAKMMMEVP